MLPVNGVPQENTLNPNVRVTSLTDIRGSTNKRNMPTGVVTPIRHQLTVDVTAEEQPRTGEEVQHNTEKEACVVRLPRNPAVDDLYCPTRMFKVVFIGDSGVGKTTFIHR